MIKILIIILLFLFSFQNALAHGIGNEVSKNASDLVFELGIDDKTPKAGKLATMTLAIHDSQDNFADVDDLWIRISKEETIFMSSPNFFVKSGDILSMTYVFPEAGNYTIDVTLGYNGKKASTHFYIEATESKSFIYPIAIIVSLIIGLVIGIIYKSKIN